MQNRHSNSAESFQLLQLSDDSKSLSDLELPEVVFQRKRKVRRKTRSKTNRLNHHETDDSVKFNCKYVSIWMCVALSCAWLFSLSYMLAIVHSEYEELNIDMKKLSAFCSSMPETLQKLHESSKTLETNQTAISQKIFEVQQRIETVEKEFSQLKESIRKGDGPDGDKAVDLKNTVAGFGAKIQSLENDVKNFHESFNGIQTAQQQDKNQLTTLQLSIERMQNATPSSYSAGVTNETSIWMKNMTEHYSSDLKNISDRLIAINDTLSQKVKSIDDEMHDHKNKLDGMSVSIANVSSHVDSIESEWPKFKQANQKLDAFVGAVNNDVINLKANVDGLNARLAQQATNSAQDKPVSNSVSPFNVPKGLVNGLQPSLNESKDTEFPAGILAGATAPKTPLPNTPQSSSNSSASQPASQSQSQSQPPVAMPSSSSSIPSTTTTPTPAPIMMH